MVKWDAQMDQFILIQLITQTGLSFDASQRSIIIRNWPTAQFGPAPTDRAITEHLKTIKGQVKAVTGTNGAAPATPPTTGRKIPNRTPATKKKGANVTGIKKRRRVEDSDDEDGIERRSPSHPSLLKEEDYLEDLDDGDGGAPTPGVRKALERQAKYEAGYKRLKAMEAAKRSDDETDIDSLTAADCMAGGE